MRKIEKKLISKYLNNECSEEENKIVLRWFKTPEGAHYLEETLDSEIQNLLKEDHVLSGYSKKPDSERILSVIRSNICAEQLGEKHSRIISKRDYLLPYMKVAAILMVIFLTSLFYLVAYEKKVEEIEVASRHYATSEGEQTLLTLHDGSTIMMNSNSEIWVSGDYLTDSREVELQGEAYFNVVDIPGSPFIIHARKSMIEVLGTAFNVKSYDWQDNVQVSVMEGRVSFISTVDHTDKRSLELTHGQFAYLDFSDNNFSIEDFGVENYLVWKSGRLIFEDLPLEKVCLQLKRLYGIECAFDDEALKSMCLTSNFSDDSLDKTLSVIALSLGINYQFDNDKKVIWKYNDKQGETTNNEQINIKKGIHENTLQS